LLTRSLGTGRGLQNLFPERTDDAKIRVTLRLAGGDIRDFLFESGESTEDSLVEPRTKILLPDMSRSDVAWNFLDKNGKTALLKVDDMSGYREACEDWIASGMSEGVDMARAAYQKFHGQAAPEQVEDILAGIPSATDVFKDLVAAMKRAGTTHLIVDLRENTGGNDLMVRMLLYFLFGKESMVSYDKGFQISRYSELYFQVYANASMEEINRNRTLPLRRFTKYSARNFMRTSIARRISSYSALPGHTVQGSPCWRHWKDSGPRWWERLPHMREITSGIRFSSS